VILSHGYDFEESKVMTFQTTNAKMNQLNLTIYSTDTAAQACLVAIVVMAQVFV